MASKTIAFSTDGDYWKTRYSFLPSCYAYVDNKMITCINSIGAQAWLHNEFSPKCNYYGTQSTVQMTVASNQEPSRNKFFKNLSLETDFVGWDATILTHSDSNTINEAQLTFIDSTRFVSKEGARYTDIPRNVSNSTANIVFLGEKLETTVDGLIKFKSSIKNSATMISPEAKVIGFTDGVARCVVDGIAKDYNGQTDAYGVESIVDDKTIKLTSNVGMQVFNSSSFDSIFLAYPSAIDGDFMRGRVAVLTLETAADVGGGFELYAINVDYEYSGLDT